MTSKIFSFSLGLGNRAGDQRLQLKTSPKALSLGWGMGWLVWVGGEGKDGEKGMGLCPLSASEEILM